MRRRLIKLLSPALDWLGVLLTPAVAAFAKLHARLGPANLPRTFRIWDSLGILPVRYHYYQPVFDPKSLPNSTWTRESPMPGVSMNLAGQRALLQRLRYSNELLEFPRDRPDSKLGYFYNNHLFEAGDAEILYSLIRHYRPKRFVEIGSGFSTRMAKAAFAANVKEGAERTRHLCIEPFEMPWLEQMSDIEVIRSRVEDVDLTIFDELGDGDMLFIDSSHVVRTGGDVCWEYLEILPRLRPGVIVHIHDIFFPFEYPRRLQETDRYYWTEQYLLQAFLAFNEEFEVLLSLNYVAAHHRDELVQACPILATEPGRIPGSFWMRRV